jgi:16S rRNA U1498 N3-methylase RsmE
MNVQQIYEQARKQSHYSLVLLIEFLLHEKQVLKETDKEDNLTYYLQERFQQKMNNHLLEYERIRNTK